MEFNSKILNGKALMVEKYIVSKVLKSENKT